MVRVSQDGTKVYVNDPTDVIFQYNLTTPWDLSTGSYASKSFSLSSQGSDFQAFELSLDGTKLYALNTPVAGNWAIYQYTLSTAWDISTASYDSVTFSPASNPAGRYAWHLDISNSGRSLVVTQYVSPAAIYQYTLSTPYDISTATYTGNNIELSSYLTGTGVRLFAFSEFGFKFNAGSGDNNDSVIHQFDLDTHF